MSVFDPVWEALSPREQARVIGLLVQGVDYDGADGKMSITFHSTGIKALAQQLADQKEIVGKRGKLGLHYFLVFLLDTRCSLDYAFRRCPTSGGSHDDAS